MEVKNMQALAFVSNFWLFTMKCLMITIIIDQL